MAKYITRENRYIKQKGQQFPSYVQADPDHPEIIELDDDVKADARLVPYGSEVELKQPLVPAHGALTQEAVPTAARLQGPQATPPTKRGRIADGQ